MLAPSLVPLDGSPLAERALPFATALAHRSHGRMILLRVVDPAPWGPEPDSDQNATTYLSALAKQLQEEGLQVETVVESGYQADIGRRIQEVAASREARLIVMSTHGRAGLGRWIYGSTADQILRQADQPVLLVPATCQQPWPKDGPLRVLLPLDDSEIAEEAFGPINQLAATMPTELVLLHVVEPSTHAQLFPSQLVANAEARLARLAETIRSPDRPVETKVVLGFAIPTIAETARETKADLIAMATHGRGGLGRLVLGSVATATLQRSTVPLLLVRPSALRGPAEQVESTPERSAMPEVPVRLSPEQIELAERALWKMYTVPETEWYQVEPLRELLRTLHRTQSQPPSSGADR